MSYTIEYDKQFLRSERGITPCWNAGDNNVTQYIRGREIRSREWCIFHNLFGTTEEALLASIQPSLGGYNEHWMKNGKWVTDEMLIRWIKNGCKNAASIEDVLSANHIRSVRAYAYVYERETLNHELHCDRYISTTEELDAWIDEVRSYKDTTEGKYIYPVIELCFPYDKLVHPAPKSEKTPESVVIKAPRYGYLVEVTERGSSWNKDIKHAKVCAYAEAESILASNYMHGAKMVNAEPLLKNPYNAVIKNSGKEEYVQQISSKRIWFTARPESAKHYPNLKAAQQALERLAKKWSKATEYVAAEV